MRVKERTSEQSFEDSVTYNWGIDKLNRLREKKAGAVLEVAYSYDARNNMVTEDHHGSTSNDRTYVYDDLNRLIQVKDASENVIAAYRYDAFNRRIIKTVDQTTYRYSYDDWNIVEISTSASDYINIIDHGMDNHIAIEVFNGTNSEIYYFLRDERGNVVALTDDSGNIVERYRYRVYGEHIVLDELFVEKDCGVDTCFAGEVHNFLWGGSMHEPETDLYWMRNRYYHKEMKRFINQDPIGIWGDANNLGNGFAYVAGMVIEATDPTGLETNDSDPDNYQGTGMPKSPSYLDFKNEMVDKMNIDVIQGVEEAYKEVVKQISGLRGLESLVSFAKTGSKEDFAAILLALEAIGKKPGGLAVFDALVKSMVNSIKRVDALGNDWFKITTKNETLYYDWKTGNTYRQKGGKWFKQTKGGTFWNPDGEWEECDDPGVGSMPSDPDSGNDAVQNYLMNNILKDMLKLKTEEEGKGRNSLEKLGPVIKHDDNGRRVFIFNPYYRGKDPMEEVLWRIKTDSGTWGFIRNPFAPGDARTWSNTYEKFQQSGFIQPEVDPYWQ